MNGNSILFIKKSSPAPKKYLEPGDHVLDFKCATGTKTIMLARETASIHGLDISEEMIRIAQRKKQEANIRNITFSRGTIFDHTLKEDFFDKIISYGVLHLTDNCEQLVERIYELLKPGGLFISTTVCLKEKMAIKNRVEFSAYRLLKKMNIFPLHLNMFTFTDVKEVIEGQGFRIVKAEKILHGITAGFVVAEKKG